LPVPLYYRWGVVGRSGQELLSAWVPAEQAVRFKVLARQRDGGVSAALGRMVGEALGDGAPEAPSGTGQGEQVKIRLRGEERYALGRAAAERGTTPAGWLRALALVHLTGRPQWNREELEALREIGREVRRIGVNVNQIAHALNAAAQIGQCPPAQGEAAERCLELVRLEMRRLAGVVTGNFDYYGLPGDERPTAARGAVERQNRAEELAVKQRKARPKLRQKKFLEGKGNGRD
jgi:hypothetical protein